MTGTSEDAVTRHIPTTPCYNKYDKICRPVSFLTVFCHAPSDLAIDSYVALANRKLSGYDPQNDNDLLDSQIGYTTTADYQVRERMRLRKSCGFVRSQSVKDKLLTVTMALQVQMRLLGANFSE